MSPGDMAISLSRPRRVPPPAISFALSRGPCHRRPGRPRPADHSPLSHVRVRFADVNECLQIPSPCEASCRNLDGGFACGCPAGFVLDTADNSTCRDLDECAVGQHICQQLCVNTHGSYKCGCRPGYRQVGDRCLGKRDLTSGFSGRARRGDEDEKGGGEEKTRTRRRRVARRWTRETRRKTRESGGFPKTVFPR